ncbi:MAG: hypothetical protein KDA75_08870, partial [Planctomycetaceae bacterium]|nr:hypothetical protein [Planctomycetaceae bacterium]
MSNPTPLTREILLLVLVSLAAGSMIQAQPLEGRRTLKGEVERTAKNIKSAMRDATDIKIAEFQDLSQSRFSGSVGPGLKVTLQETLKGMGIVANEDASHILTAEYFVNDLESLKAGDPLSLTIRMGLRNRRGQKLVTLLPIDAEFGAEHFANVNTASDMARIMGFHGQVTSDQEAREQLDRQPDNSQRQREMGQGLIHPQGFLNGRRIRSSEQSSYEVEILARKLKASGSAQPRQPSLDKGLPFVNLGLNELYEVRVYNNSSEIGRASC